MRVHFEYNTSELWNLLCDEEVMITSGWIIILSITIISYVWCEEIDASINPYTWNGAFSNFASIVTNTLELGSEVLKMGVQCPLVEDSLNSVRLHLPLYIKGQPEALEAIFNATAAWEFSRAGGMPTALVLSLTGPTGVGKTETAFRLAEALLEKRDRVGSSRRFKPRGLLVIRGEDFVAAEGQSREEAARELARMRRVLLNRVGEHLSACDGAAVVVCDEVQKMTPGLLDVLLEAFGDRGTLRFDRRRSSPSPALINPFKMVGSAKGRGPNAGWSSGGGGRDRADEMDEVERIEVSTGNCVFVLVSDVGAESMVRLALGYGDRSNVPVMRLRKEVTAALESHDSTRPIAKEVNEVIPFMPMERTHVQLVLQSKLASIGRDHHHIFWQDLSVDSAVVRQLAGPHFVKYKRYSTRISASHGTEVRESEFAVYGARALENAGPLQDLRSLLFTHMRPWRPGRVLHVGLVDERGVRWSHDPEQDGQIPAPTATTATSSSSSSSPSAAAVAATPTPLGLVELRWCQVHDAQALTLRWAGTGHHGGVAEEGQCDDRDHGHGQGEECACHSRMHALGSPHAHLPSLAVGRYADMIPDSAELGQLTTAARNADVDDAAAADVECDVVWRGRLAGG